MCGASTGGKTVLHDHEITYAVVSSEDLFFKEHDLHQSYMLISRVLVQAMRSLGVDASLSKGSAAELSRSSNPCFSFPYAPTRSRSAEKNRRLGPKKRQAGAVAARLHPPDDEL